MKILTKKLVLLGAVLVVFALSFFGMACHSPAFARESEADARAKVLMDFGTGQVLFEENSHQKMPIASVTKLMTLLLSFEAIDSGQLALDEVLTASKNAAGMGGSQVFIEEGGTYSVQSLLHAIIISSANDASVMIAERLSGTEQNFVTKMNTKIQALGGKNTNYGNATGLPCVTAYSCAYDVALVMRQVLKFPLYFEICNIWMENFEHPDGRVTQMANTNKLLRTYSGCDAGKTGSTGEAGFCLSASAKRGDMRLISVVLGASDSRARFAQSTALLDYGFDNFVSKNVLSNDCNLDISLEVRNAKNLPQVRAEENFDVVFERGKERNFEISYQLDSLAAPQKAGTVVGQVIITDDGVVQREINLVLTADIEAKSLWDNVRSITSQW